MDVKQCGRCKKVLQLSCFNKNKRLSYGVDWQCRECEKALAASRRDEMRCRLNSEIDVPASKTCFNCKQSKPSTEFNRSFHRRNGLAPYCKECAKEKRREYDASDLKKASRDASRLKLRERVNARAMVSWHVKTGNIEKQPCSICGEKASVAHHEDYAKPLDVVWLCRPHHAARHVQMRDEEILRNANPRV